MEEGRLKVAVWVDLEKQACKSCQSLQEVVKAAERLGEGEISCFYESCKGMDDCISSPEVDILSFLLCPSRFQMRWHSVFDLWQWLGSSALGQLIALGKQTSAEVLLAGLPSGMQMGVKVGKLLEYVVQEIRDPMECAPTQYQQIKNLLDFYEPEVELQGRFQTLGLSAVLSISAFSQLLSLNKRFAFL